MRYLTPECWYATLRIRLGGAGAKQHRGKVTETFGSRGQIVVESFGVMLTPVFISSSLAIVN